MTFFDGQRRLLEAYRNGDEAVLRDVYFAYVKDVALFVATGWFHPKTRSRVGRIADFEVQAELIQETFLRAFAEGARKAYDGIRPYKLYLLTITKNVIVDYLRRRPKDSLSHVAVDLDDVDAQRFFAEQDSGLSTVPEIDEAQLDWQRCVQETRAFVQTLDTLQQQFISLRFEQEKSLLEVARALHITRGKARFLEKDLARRLKKHFQSAKCPVSFNPEQILRPKQNGIS